MAERSSTTMATLADLELFHGEGSEVLEWVMHSCGVQSFVPGEVLLDPSRDNDEFYIILAGRAEVRFSHEKPCPSLYLESGECAGEMSIFEDTRPSATVVTDSHCHVLVMSAKVVWTLIDRSQVVARNLLHILSARVRRNNVALMQSHVQQRIHERDAHCDALTGLYNRRWMDRVLVRLVDRCAEAGQPLGLLMVDTDHFKRYNDDYGHLAGDHVLQTIAAAITENVRSIGQACRYGGDEFVVVLPQVGPVEVMQIAERLCKSVGGQAAHQNGDSLPFPPSVSIGVAALGPGMNVRQLLATADAALYRAKVAGRNVVSR